MIIRTRNIFEDICINHFSIFHHNSLKNVVVFVTSELLYVGISNIMVSLTLHFVNNSMSHYSIMTDSKI